MTNVASIIQLETKKVQEMLEKASLSSTVQMTTPDIQQLTETQITQYKRLLSLTDEVNEKTNSKLEEISHMFDKMSALKNRLSTLKSQMESALPQEVTGHYSMNKTL